MEYRKLISFGKSSYVVSLPKSWVQNNKLEKGDLIHFNENGFGLVLCPKKVDGKKEKEIKINVDRKSMRRLQREIISAYIKDFKTITLVGSEIKDKAIKIQDTIKNLMALEVMEQTSQKIVAKDFLDIQNISVFNLIRKMDVTVRSMLEDCGKGFDEDNIENIHLRDQDINRLSFLSFRIIEYGLENSTFMYKKHYLDNKKLLSLWWLVFNIEKIGDGVKRVARNMREVNLDVKEKEKFLELLSEAKNAYSDLMKSFHNKEKETTHKMLEAKYDLIEKCEDFYLINKNRENVGLLVEKLKTMVVSVHNLGEVVYQYDFEEIL